MICSEKERERIKINLKNNTIEKQEDMKNIAEYIDYLEQENANLKEIETEHKKINGELRADNYEANNIINDYREERQKLIDKLERIVDDDEMSDVEYQKKRELALEILSILKR